LDGGECILPFAATQHVKQWRGSTRSTWNDAHIAGQDMQLLSFFERSPTGQHMDRS
jgi:hypothetical protein